MTIGWRGLDQDRQAHSNSSARLWSSPCGAVYMFAIGVDAAKKRGSGRTATLPAKCLARRTSEFLFGSHSTQTACGKVRVERVYGITCAHGLACAG